MTGVKHDTGKREFSCYISDKIYVSILESYYFLKEIEIKNIRLSCYLNFLKGNYVESGAYLLLLNRIDPVLAHDIVCRVGECGAKKYGLNNWKSVENGSYRYRQAFMRHFFKSGKNKDFGLPHWAHGLWNLIQLENLKRDCQKG